MTISKYHREHNLHPQLNGRKNIYNYGNVWESSLTRKWSLSLKMIILYRLSSHLPPLLPYHCTPLFYTSPPSLSTVPPLHLSGRHPRRHSGAKSNQCGQVGAEGRVTCIVDNFGGGRGGATFVSTLLKSGWLLLITLVNQFCIFVFQDFFFFR